MYHPTNTVDEMNRNQIVDHSPVFRAIKKNEKK